MNKILIPVRWMSRVKTRHTHTPYWQYEQLRKPADEKLTLENKQFLDEVVSDRLQVQRQCRQTSSPLLVEPWALGERQERSRRTGVIAQKIGVYPHYTKGGVKFLTTLLQVVDNHVIKYHSPEEYAETEQGKKRFRKQLKLTGRMGCLVVGAESSDPRLYTKDYCGLFNEAGVLPKKKLSRFFITGDAAIQPGTPLTAGHFRAGDYVDVYGKTIDHGFQGVMKRHKFLGMPASHGVTKTHRRGGNIGYGGKKQRVWPGTRMPGHMGSERRVMRGLKIWRINYKYNILFVHGPAVPGHNNSWVLIYDSVFDAIRRNPESDDHPPFPTLSEEDEMNLPEEVYAEDLHDYSLPSYNYAESTGNK